MAAPVRTGESQFAFAEALSQLANKRGRCAKRDTRLNRSKRTYTRARAQPRTRAQVLVRQDPVLSVSLLARLDHGWLMVESSLFDAKSRCAYCDRLRVHTYS